MRLFSVKSLGCVLALLVLALATQPAKAAYAITFTNVEGVNVAPGQIVVTMTQLGTNGVSFRFDNKNVANAVTSHITNIGFDDGSLFGSGTSPNPAPTPGVDYSTFLGGKFGVDNWSFNLTRGFQATPDGSNGSNGNSINVGEYLIIDFALTGGQTYDDVVDSLKLAQTNPQQDLPGGLRLAFHLQGIAPNGSSSKFISSGGSGTGGTGGGGSGITPTPAPAGLVLLASAMPFAFGLRRWLNRREVAA